MKKGKRVNIKINELTARLKSAHSNTTHRALDLCSESPGIASAVQQRLMSQRIRAHLLALALLICCSTISSASQEGRVFTDEDLSRYDTKQDKSVRNSELLAPQNRTPQPQWGSTVRPRDDGLEKDEWCQKGKDSDNRIEAARRKLEEANSPENPVAIISGTRGAMAQANLRKYQDQVQREYDAAKAARQQLEDDTHRARIPAGWLRCQFE